MKHLFTLLFIILIIPSLKAQHNGLDSQGKKHGLHKIWLDERLNEVKDSSSASYFHYLLYSHGYNFRQMQISGGKGWKLEPEFRRNSTPQPLSGYFRWTDEKGVLRSEHNFTGGHPVSHKHYRASGIPETEFRMNNLWEGDSLSAYCRWWDKKGQPWNYFHRKSGGKWYLHPSNPDSTDFLGIYSSGDTLFGEADYFRAGTRIRRSQIMIYPTPDKKGLPERNSAPHGNTTTWYDDGRIRSEGSYRRGKKNNDWKYYDQQGNLVPEAD